MSMVQGLTYQVHTENVRAEATAEIGEAKMIPGFEDALKDALGVTQVASFRKWPGKLVHLVDKSTRTTGMDGTIQKTKDHLPKRGSSSMKPSVVETRFTFVPGNQTDGQFHP